MNREKFYQEIGNIDDDLILAANRAYEPKSQKTMFVRIAGIAACFCLLLGVLLFESQKDTLYFNDISKPMASKIAVHDDENTEIISMTYQELLAYYDIEDLPDVLLENLSRTEQSYFALYQDQAGNILYDANMIYYCNADKSKTLTITFFKTTEAPIVSRKNIKLSKINGVPILLAAFSVNTDYTMYWADFKTNGVSVQLSSDGLNEKEFVNVIKEFLKQSGSSS